MPYRPPLTVDEEDEDDEADEDLNDRAQDVLPPAHPRREARLRL